MEMPDTFKKQLLLLTLMIWFVEYIYLLFGMQNGLEMTFNYL